MLLFRKSKVLKVLKEYHRIYNTVISDATIGKEELEALRNIELEQLAIAYDNLKGYEYYLEPVDGMDLNVKYNMPDRSRYVPSSNSAHSVKLQSLAGKVRLYRNFKFLETREYIFDVSASAGNYLREGGKTCWKGML